MPELPEVEIIKQDLSCNILNKTIISTWNSNKKFKLPLPEAAILITEKIINIFRRNKYIIIETATSWLIFHLGMSGRLILSNTIPTEKHIHFWLQFDQKSFLYFQDPRRFGVVLLVSKKEYPTYNNHPLLVRIGVEPLSEQFKFSILKYKFNTKKNIKTLLMDQSIICGIGNIYASEILFLSKINPTRPCNSLTELEIKTLLLTIPQVLKKAISLGGSSISDFIHTNGTKGNMQNFYNVYNKVGKKCNCCTNIIKKIIQNGRSTFFCENCQK